MKVQRQSIQTEDFSYRVLKMMKVTDLTKMIGKFLKNNSNGVFIKFILF